MRYELNKIKERNMGQTFNILPIAIGIHHSIFNN
jgi:hypothetical protein